MFVDIDNRAQTLTPVHLGSTSDEDCKRREAFVQNLVHDHPSLVPMAEIEPAFSPLISVCRELPTPAGYIDNFWITPWGGLVFGEAKLVRNPQARREVVAQVLDYASAVASWTFDDLQQAVRTALKQSDLTLWSLVQSESDLDEAQFVDAVERRLRTGRLLLLIIGDGIREGVEALTAHLQLHAGLHVGLALLDLSLWRNPAGGLVVVPRVPMRTVLIERGIVQVEAAGVRITPAISSRVALPSRASQQVRSVTSSEGEFFDHLSSKRPELIEPLNLFLAGLGEIGVTPEVGKTIKLLMSPSPDVSVTAGFIDSSGKIWVNGAWSGANRMGNPAAGETYQSALAAIIGGQVRQYAKSPPEVVDQQGRGADVATLLVHQAAWKEAIASFRGALAEQQSS